MNDIKLLVARNKFLMAKNFYFNMDKFIKIVNDNNDEFFNLLEILKEEKFIKSHFALDINKDVGLLQKHIKSFFTGVFNESYISSIAKGLLESYPTLIRVNLAQNKKSLVYDDFLKEDFEIYNEDPDFKKGESLFVRIIEIDGYKFILDKISTFKDDERESFLTSLSNLFKASNNLESKTRKEKILILKKSFPDLFLAYMITMAELFDIDEEIIFEHKKEEIKNYFFSNEDLEIFERFSKISQAKNSLNEDELIYIFSVLEGFLNNKSLNFSDFSKFSFIDIIKDAALKGAFLNSSQFKKAVLSLRDFYNYALKYSDRFKKPYEELNEISENIFIYLNNLENSTEGFYFDEKILSLLDEPFYFNLIDKFGAFVDMLSLPEITAKKSSQAITDAGVYLIAKNLTLKPAKEVKRPNQSHYPLINFFFNFLNIKKMIKLDSREISFTSKLNQFLFLDLEEQFAIFLHYLLNKNFLNLFLRPYKIENYFKDLKCLLNRLEKKSPLDITDMEIKKRNRFLIDTLADLNLVSLEGNLVSFTETGQRIFKSYKNNLVDGNTINIEDYMK
ncbi:hypothetical protein [Peptoniphilus catoniae]|uniref:hypothetical protein n=1 Tax=Peptoniphilus catoniae TaxID=1660341 RepID=UPI0010FD2066|nr:hypothetical protein [Peptoniphilus catoniae]